MSEAPPRLQWHRRNNSEMLDVARRLRNLEAFGALCGFIDLYCERAGDIHPDDDGLIAGNLGIDIRKWRSIKKRLLASGYLEERYNRLVSSVAEKALHDGLARIHNAKRAGRQSAANRAETQREPGLNLGDTPRGAGKVSADISQSKNRDYNGLSQTAVQRPFQPYTETYTYTDSPPTTVETQATRAKEPRSLGDHLKGSPIDSVRDATQAGRRRSTREKGGSG